MDNKDTEALVAEMLASFVSRFEAVEERKDADDSLTTKEVHALFQDFFPGDYSEENIANLLYQHFKLDYDPVLRRFIWLMRQK